MPAGSPGSHWPTAPKSLGGSMTGCIEKMMNAGYSKDVAARICQSIKQRIGG